MTVSDYLIKRIKKINKHVFLLVGGGNMYLADALNRHKAQYQCMHHEQSLTMAAEAYARITGNPAVCIVTTGPGGINALNGVAGAYLDSIPMIVISGQVRLPLIKTGKIRQIGDQEVSIVDMAKPITKFAEIIKDPIEVEYLFEKALYIATHGRPGPVWLDVPLDIQSAEYVDKYAEWKDDTAGALYYGYKKQEEFHSYIEPGHKMTKDTIRYAMDKIITELKFAQKPVIIAGNGIRIGQAVEIFKKFLKKVDAPVALAFNARDILPTLHSQNIDSFGLGGHQTTNHTIQQADLLLILGCRMAIRHIGYNFGEVGQKAIKIMVDIDEEELNKFTFVPDIKVNMDVRDFLEIMVSKIKEPLSYGVWMLQATKPIPLPKTILGKVMGDLAIETMNRDYIVVSANGTIPTWLSRYLVIKDKDRFIVNTGCGSMGYGLPAAIGAALASDKMVICFEGDGSLQMNIQELQTMKARKLNIKLFVINNGGYASIKATQDAYFRGKYIGRGPESGVTFPKLHPLINAYGLYYVTDIHTAVNHKGPVVCEIFTDEPPPYKADYVWKSSR